MSGETRVPAADGGAENSEKPKSKKKSVRIDAQGPLRKRGSRHLWRIDFLAILRRTMNVGLACAHAGVARKTAYKHRNKYPRFAQAWDDALDTALDSLEFQAFTLAMGTKGDPEKGIPAKEPSERMLMFILSRRRPESYGDSTKVELTGRNGGAIEHATVWTEEQRAAAVALLHARVGAIPGAKIINGEIASGGSVLAGSGEDLDGIEGDARPLAEERPGVHPPEDHVAVLAPGGEINCGGGVPGEDADN